MLYQLLAAVGGECTKEHPNDPAATSQCTDKRMGKCAQEHPDDTTAASQCMKERGAEISTPSDEIAKLKDAVAKIDTAPILFEVQNVITIDKTDYRATCKATIHWSGGDGWFEFARNDYLFTFTVEKTDEGKLYVTESGLD